jgi:hypothetical protein
VGSFVDGAYTWSRVARPERDKDPDQLPLLVACELHDHAEGALRSWPLAEREVHLRAPSKTRAIGTLGLTRPSVSHCQAVELEPPASAASQLKRAPGKSSYRLPPDTLIEPDGQATAGGTGHRQPSPSGESSSPIKAEKSSPLAAVVPSLACTASHGSGVVISNNCEAKRSTRSATRSACCAVNSPTADIDRSTLSSSRSSWLTDSSAGMTVTVALEADVSHISDLAVTPDDLSTPSDHAGCTTLFASFDPANANEGTTYWSQRAGCRTGTQVMSQWAVYDPTGDYVSGPIDRTCKSSKTSPVTSCSIPRTTWFEPEDGYYTMYCDGENQATGDLDETYITIQVLTVEG